MLSDSNDKNYNSSSLSQFSSESINQIDSMINSLDEIIWFYDLKKNKLFVNKSIERITGYKGDEILWHNHWVNLIYSEDSHLYKLFIADLVKFGRGESEYRILTKNGKIKWLHCTASYIYDENHIPSHIKGIARDISAQRKSEKVIKNQKTLIEKVLSNVDSIVWSTSPQSEILYVSKGAERLLGHSLSALKNKRVMKSIIHPQDLDRFNQIIGQTLKDGFCHSEFRVVLPSGEMRWLYSRSESILENGVPIRVDGVMTNITEIKKAKLLIEDQQRKLDLSSKLATLGQMSSSIGHEIRSPLSVINNHAGYLMDLAEKNKLNPKDVVDICGKIEGTVLRIEKTLSSLSAFIQKSQDNAIHKVQIKKIFNDVSEICKMRFGEKKVDLQLPEVKDDIEIECDPSGIYLLLVNILNNAFQAASNVSEKWVKVTFENQPDEIIISVTDSGKAFAQDIQEKIVNRFYTTKDLGDGAGLGFSFAIKAVQDHHGALIFDEENPNTCFIIKLPKKQKRQS